MTQKNHIHAFLNNWPSRQDFAVDLSFALGDAGPVGVDRVHKWARTGSIPSKFWQAIIEAARRNGVTLTADQLAEWHAIRPDLETAGP